MVDVLDSCISCCVLCVLGSATCNMRYVFLRKVRLPANWGLLATINWGLLTTITICLNNRRPRRVAPPYAHLGSINRILGQHSPEWVFRLTGTRNVGSDDLATFSLFVWVPYQGSLRWGQHSATALLPRSHGHGSWYRLECGRKNPIRLGFRSR
jgi:hypothetical protein